MSETAVAKRGITSPMADVVGGLMPHIPALLPPDIPTEQFRAALFLELSGRPALAECTTESLREAVIKAATYGMLPGRDCHLLPFANRRKGGKKDVTYVPNYFGLILALERTGKIRRAFAHPVYEGDEYLFDLFDDHPHHRPAVTLGKKPGKELFYYGAVMFKDGSCAFEVLTLDDLDAIRKTAPASEQGPWVSDRVMMNRKSCIKRVAKYVRLTPELRQMLEEEESQERDAHAAARFRENVHDLFGDAAEPLVADPVAHARPVSTAFAETNGSWRDNVATLAATLPDALTDSTPRALLTRVNETCERALRLVEQADTPTSVGEAMLEELRTLRNEVSAQMSLGDVGG